MKVLIVANYQHGFFAPFITEQVDAIKELGVEVDFFPVVAKGIKGYLSLRKLLVRKIREYQPDVIHAHYGLSCLLANLQRKVPVISTYHGSDINLPYVRKFSKLAMLLSGYNIFVSQKNIEIAKPKHNYALIPCGVNLDNFAYVDRERARQLLGYDSSAKLVLFAGSFRNKIKNYPLAKNAITELDGVELIELKGYTREQVALLMYAVDVCLMTSFTEGSPQFIKEAMACGCPIVSVDVGDVGWVCGDVDGCYITPYLSLECADNISKALYFSSIHNKTNGAKRIKQLGLDNKSIANKIIQIYRQFINDKNN